MNKRLIIEVGIIVAIGAFVFWYERKKKADAANADTTDVQSQYDETQPDYTDMDYGMSGLPSYMSYNVGSTSTYTPPSSGSNYGVPTLAPIDTSGMSTGLGPTTPTGKPVARNTTSRLTTDAAANLAQQMAQSSSPLAVTGQVGNAIGPEQVRQ